MWVANIDWSSRKSSIRRLELNPYSAQTITWVTSSAGGASFTTVEVAMPPHSMPSIENFVTQWKSPTTVS